MNSASPVMSGAVLPEPLEVGYSSSPVSDALHVGDDGFSMQIITWNVGTAVPPDDVTSLLGLNSTNGRIDMYVIGLQEVNSMINKRLKDAIFTDQWSELFMDTLSPFGYVLVTSERMQGQLLLVFVKYYLLPSLQDIQTNCTRTGLGGYWGNKGGVSARLSLCGHMICFLNCHLPAHMENAEQRMDDFESILQLQQFNGPLASGVLDHDVVFWFGDLNFRIEQYDIRFVKNAIEKNKLDVLWEKDQLNIAKVIEPALNGFQEGPLSFRPTYKYDVGTNTFDTSSKKRKPAWTDRILWRVKMSDCYDLLQNSTLLSRGKSPVGNSNHIEVLQHAYHSHMEYFISDHKPVSAIFCLKFSQKLQTPLIQLQVEDEWNKPSDAVVRYRMANSFAKSSWDWLGLYRVGFKHHKDYITYVWAKHEDADSDKQCYQVMFSEDSMPKGTGEYILCYYSNNSNTIVGVTEPFQIILPSSSSDSSKSDSDSSSDTEEMSTLKLIRPKSRSPSPGKMKKRRSRSRSKSPVIPIAKSLQGLNLRVGSKHKSKSRSPSPRGGPSPKARPLKEPGARAAVGDSLSPDGDLHEVSSPSAGPRHSAAQGNGQGSVANVASATCTVRPGSQALQPHDGSGVQHPRLSPKLSRSPLRDGPAVPNPGEAGPFPSSKNHPSRSPSPKVWVTSAHAGTPAREGQNTAMTTERTMGTKTTRGDGESTTSLELELKPVPHPSPKTTRK
ncbi:phosphatidylinositol 4,5-bisphosphate 5-phosphatase A isoform X1 [Amblyraja radiata]|uniref:phosphatidylinositol 4,5-bisphosphate 5-phosphatase A isoform X1 n=1 Tax=Amblyraja radiata TaxID=386614 RepID=UPI001401FF97|nr:phosphatidylinositol 4,5-bisphosphate 5-phosphatase A isoform X1 [Amblyraja radiata]